MKKNPTESEKLEAFDQFRSDLSEAVEEGVDDHESKMTKWDLCSSVSSLA